ncbi:hypothetical protein CAEBREN_05415 [Caenorhabditis brenneri]|uniref:Uncharacterized protein n=1 Tax=Caenorhabditis brenneri TaxID=135651 RepID=G0MHM7_CAEBE|nr:hypothetical protein CAEBREN_05415 [Caenorhabditis brenneri]
MEKAKFTEVRASYNGLVQELMESSNPRLNKLSMKYHSEAFEIIYVGTNRIYEYDELAEQRHALTQIVARIQEEASHIT